MRDVVLIKICGLTNVDDAAAAAKLGADFLGFVLAPSPRRLDQAGAAAFWEDLPKGVPLVGVFKDQSHEEVREALRTLRFDYLQFHGSEDPAFCRSFGLPVIRALPARHVDELQALEIFSEAAELFLVDLPKTGRGGEVLPLEVARAAAGLSRPTLLAGGIDPGNVENLLRAARPYGIDVARGVEYLPGKKDHDRMETFFARVRRASGTIRKGAES